MSTEPGNVPEGAWSAEQLDALREGGARMITTFTRTFSRPEPLENRTLGYRPTPGEPMLDFLGRVIQGIQAFKDPNLRPHEVDSLLDLTSTSTDGEPSWRHEQGRANGVPVHLFFRQYPEGRQPFIDRRLDVREGH